MFLPSKSRESFLIDSAFAGLLERLCELFYGPSRAASESLDRTEALLRGENWSASVCTLNRCSLYPFESFLKERIVFSWQRIRILEYSKAFNFLTLQAGGTSKFFLKSRPNSCQSGLLSPLILVVTIQLYSRLHAQLDRSLSTAYSTILSLVLAREVAAEDISQHNSG